MTKKKPIKKVLKKTTVKKAVVRKVPARKAVTKKVTAKKTTTVKRSVSRIKAKPAAKSVTKPAVRRSGPKMLQLKTKIQTAEGLKRSMLLKRRPKKG